MHTMDGKLPPISVHSRGIGVRLAEHGLLFDKPIEHGQLRGDRGAFGDRHEFVLRDKGREGEHKRKKQAK
jgi:hypothetical protein